MRVATTRYQILMMLSNLLMLLIITINTIHGMFMTTLRHCRTLQSPASKAISSTLRAHIDSKFLASPLNLLLLAIIHLNHLLVFNLIML